MITIVRFTSAADRQRIEAFVRRHVRSGFYSADSPTAAELVSDSDDNLFANVLNNENHGFHKLLPDRSTHDYNLRPRSHDRSLNVRTDNKNFLSRMLFKDIYTSHFITRCILFQYIFLIL